MTAVKAAGYSSAPRRFDPLNQASRPLSGGFQKSELSPEEQCREVEKKVHGLLEESAEASAKGQHELALEKAREAGKTERALCKQKESLNIGDQINPELTHAVCFNLAHHFHMNKLYTEALNAYQSIVKSKQFAHSGRLRVNMGNIYYEQKKYPSSIKMYRMALDQVPNSSREIRFKIMRNIGNAFVQLGQYQDAIAAYETVMDNMPDHQTGFNFLICVYLMGDVERMKAAFILMLQIEDESLIMEEDGGEADLQDDGLRREIRKRQNRIDRYITLSGRLIAPIIDRTSPIAGFVWVAEQLNRHNYGRLRNELEMAKAMHFMANRDFDSAVAVLKEFEKKEHDLKARAATNLAFLYFLEGDLENSEQYSELAIKTDRYNARGLVNRGNTHFQKDELEAARTMYLEVLGMEADCCEAIYNLGLTNKKLTQLEEALAAFKKLHTLMPHSIEVVYQIADTHDTMNNSKQAIKWFEILNTKVPHDPGVLARLGAIHAKIDDETKALHFYSESHRVFPVNMDVISWLGAFYVKSEMYEKAIPFFDLAAQVQPQEVKWQLMVASCYRRIGAYMEALNKYLKIHQSHPDNVECLKYLVHLHTEMGQKDVHEFVVKLRKAERTQAAKMSTTQAVLRSHDNNNMDSTFRPPDADSPFKAPRNAAKQVKMRASPLKAGNDDDEWGNEELGDDLLPM